MVAYFGELRIFIFLYIHIDGQTYAFILGKTNMNVRNLPKSYYTPSRLRRTPPTLGGELVSPSARPVRKLGKQNILYSPSKIEGVPRKGKRV